MDSNLRRVLRQRAYVERVATEIGPGLEPLSPQYERQAGPVAALVQPLRGDLAATVAGRVAEATHVAYLEAGVEVGPGDVLEVEGKRYEALAVEDEGGQGHHLRVVVRGRD